MWAMGMWDNTTVWYVGCLILGKTTGCRVFSPTKKATEILEFICYCSRTETGLTNIILS